MLFKSLIECFCSYIDFVKTFCLLITIVSDKDSCQNACVNKFSSATSIKFTFFIRFFFWLFFLSSPFVCFLLLSFHVNEPLQNIYFHHLRQMPQNQNDINDSNPQQPVLGTLLLPLYTYKYQTDPIPIFLDYGKL